MAVAPPSSEMSMELNLAATGELACTPDGGLDEVIRSPKTADPPAAATPRHWKAIYSRLNEVKLAMEAKSHGGISSEEAAAAAVGDDDGVSTDEAEKAARILMMPPVMRNRAMVDQLVALTARNAFLKDLPPATTRQLLTSCRCETHMAGEWLFREGDVGLLFYMLLVGRISAHSRVVPEQAGAHYAAHADEEGFVAAASKAGGCVAVYDAGASFGEVALIHNQPRPHSMYVLENAILLTVSKAQYQSVLLTLQNERFQRRATALRGLDPLQGMSQQRLQHICALLHEKHFPQGAVLVEEGTTASDWYLVGSGQLRITKKVSPALRSRAQPADAPRRKPPPPPQRATDGEARWHGKGKVRGVAQGTAAAAAKGVLSPRVYIPPVLEIGHVYPGEWFGEEVILGTAERQPWTITVEAAEGVDALVVNRADFSSVFTEQLYPNLQKYFKEVAALKQERVLERFVTILERLFSSLSHHQSPATATALPPLWELPKKPPSRQPSRATRSPRGGPPLHAVALDTPRYAMLRSFSPAPPHAAAPLGPPSRQPHTSPPTNPYSPSSATVRAMPPPSPIPLWPMDTLATIGVRPAELLSDNQVGSCAAAPQQRGPSSVLREMRRSGVQFFGSSQGVTPITPRKPPAVPRPRLASERSSATGDISPQASFCSSAGVAAWPRADKSSSRRAAATHAALQTFASSRPSTLGGSTSCETTLEPPAAAGGATSRHASSQRGGGGGGAQLSSRQALASLTNSMRHGVLPSPTATRAVLSRPHAAPTPPVAATVGTSSPRRALQMELGRTIGAG